MTTYATGVRVYMTWCNSSGIDPNMVIPAPYYSADLTRFSHQVTSFGNFTGYMAFELSLSPQTIHVYRCAVIAWYKTNFIEHEFVRHPVFKQLAASLEIQWRASHEVAATRRLPFTLQMFTTLSTRVCNRHKPLEHAVLIAAMICLVLLTRKSEIIPTADNHFMREDDVTFRMRNPATGIEFMCKASLAHRHNILHLVGVSPFVRSAKNDQDGEGHRYYFPVLDTMTEKVFCFATELFIWAQRAKPQRGDPFLTYRGSSLPNPRWLDYKTFIVAIKLAAKYSGFEPNRFGTHSLRIGGATILAAAGHPNHYIQKMGRWKSLTFLQYINLACKSMEIALHSLVDSSQFTNDQLRILNPM
jgi:integrase